VFKKNIVILDTDTLSLELLQFPVEREKCSLAFIWDEDIFENRLVSDSRKAFIFEALQKIPALLLIEANSKEFFDFINKEYPNVQIYYASKYDDRFRDVSIQRVGMRYKTKEVQPLPRGFFPFYKTLMKDTRN